MAPPSPLPPRVQQVLANNAAFAEKYPAASIPKMVDMRARAKAHRQGLLVLTCLDPRCVPENFFGPDLNAGVIRNAGGRVGPDVIRSILTLRSLIDAKTVAVVHHTDCGVMHMSDEQITREAKERTPNAAAQIDQVHFGCYTAEELESSVNEDVDVLRDHPALAGMDIIGFTLETESGVVKVVDH